MPTTINFEINQGESWERIVRWEQASFVYKEITAISKAAPTILTATGHRLLDGWRFAISNVEGMTQINARNEPPEDEEYHISKLVDVNQIEINAMNSLGFTAYKSGGVIRYRPPEPLTGYTARMHLRKNAKATSPYFVMTTVTGEIELNDTLKTIKLKITDEQSELFTFSRARYDLEMIKAGEVTIPMAGSITVVKNLTK